MCFAFPVVGATLEWWVKCQRTDSRFCFQRNDPADGMIIIDCVRDRHGIPSFRMEFVSQTVSLDYHDATAIDENDIWVGSPYAVLVWTGEPMIGARFEETIDIKRVVSDELIPDYVGRAYRLHAAMRVFQRAFRRKRDRAAKSEAMRAVTPLTDDVIDIIVRRL